MRRMVEEVRKGPWTEQEDMVLVNFVHLFGDRRWDFVAKVSGLNRTGKSCRLRWVNYLHPGLKRGKMTPQEERLVLELHAKWGNRWSRIARKLPGRTDNEIKNYWRTHMRKKAQERKRNITSPSSQSSNCSSSSSSTNSAAADLLLFSDAGKATFHDTGGPGLVEPSSGNKSEETKEEGYSMDDIWKDIDLSDEDIIKPVIDEEGCNFSSPNSMVYPPWDHPLESLWRMGEEESKAFLPDNQFFSCYEYGRASLTANQNFIH